MSTPSTSTRSRRMQLAVGLMFILGILPILMAISPFGVNYGRFSPYNKNDDGLSYFREQLEQSGLGEYAGAPPDYSINTSISSMNILNRLNTTGVTVIMGPASNFDFSETLSMLFYLVRGGSLIIVDDFGTGNDILDPMFDLMENWDKIADDLGGESISIGSLMGGGESDGGEIGTSLFSIIGSVLKRFGFNNSAILMDAANNEGNPARPLITEIDHSGAMDITFTEGVSALQLEYATCLSIKINHTVKYSNGDLVLDNEGNPTYRSDWMPLTKISVGDIMNDPSLDDVALPFSLFPFYTSTSSWLETDMDSAREQRATPNPAPNPDSEWGGEAFAPVLAIPLFEGAGKMIFVSDPSIFINRWTDSSKWPDGYASNGFSGNQNIDFALNLIEYATAHQNETTKMVLFDLGHSYQPLNSPTLYSMALLKLLANISMFPLLAPFAPWFMSAIASKLVPKQRRLKPMLLTKRRGERGYSFFDQKLKDIKYHRKYYEALGLILRRLKRSFNSSDHVKEYGEANPANLAKFYAFTHASRFNERTVRNKLTQIEKSIVSPKDRKRLTEPLFREYAIYLKDLHNLFISE